jgi:hypothetical protein
MFSVALCEISPAVPLARPRPRWHGEGVPPTDASLFAGIDQARTMMAALASRPDDDSPQTVAWIDLELAKLDHVRSDLVALREHVASRSQLQLSIAEQ